MASTYLATAKNIICGNGKSMIGLMNGGASAQTLSVRRIWVCNNQLFAMTGVMLSLELRRITALTAGGIKIIPLPTKNSATALDSNVTCYCGGTATETDLFRRVLFSSDEPKQSANTQDEFNVIPNWNLIWNAGYADSNIEPLVCVAGQGVHIKCATNTAVPSIGKLIIEFTI